MFVPGTALALAQLVACASEPVALAPGSIVMVTGGFKGQAVSVSADGLRSELVRLLPGATVVEEYGMTELSSQMWAEGPGMPLRIPPWMLVSVVDPWTGAPEKRGLLRFIDLANVDTVLAIETRDEGELLPDGRLILHGRLPGAPARGCSLTVEEAMDGVGAAPVAAREPTLPRRVGLVVDEDRRRARRMVQALASLPTPRADWGQGIEVAQVARELQQAVARLSEVALLDEASTVPVAERPSTVALVAAEGVFTAALEWVALALVGGLRVQWKPPSRAPGAHDVGAVLAEHGFPVTGCRPTVRDPRCGGCLWCRRDSAACGHRPSTARVVGYGHRSVWPWWKAHPPRARLGDSCTTTCASIRAAAWHRGVFVWWERHDPGWTPWLRQRSMSRPRGSADPLASAWSEWRRRLGLRVPPRRCDDR